MSFDDILTSNKAFKAVLARLRDAATRSDDLLLLGPPGVGKLLVCEAVHQGSPRKDAAFVVLTADMAEDEVAQAIAAAKGGSIVVREPILFSHENRALLARQKDARLLLTSTRTLTEVDYLAVLFDALRPTLRNTHLRIPSLRQRPEDPVPLFEHFARLYARRLGRTCKGVSRDLADAIAVRPWPHNVSDVIRLAEHAAAFARAPVLTLRDISPDACLAPVDDAGDEILPLEESRRAAVRRAVELCAGNQSLAARKLGISRNTLRECLSPPDAKA